MTGEALGAFGNWITPRLATGGAIGGDPQNVLVLHMAGVTAIIDCQAELDDSPVLAQSGMAYLYNPTQDDGQTKSPFWFARSLSFALPLLAQPHQMIYAHCAAGVNRGPSTLYAILRAVGIPPDQAMAMLKAARPQVNVAYAKDADTAIPQLGYG